jgi:hypothetical protein
MELTERMMLKVDGGGPFADTVIQEKSALGGDAQVGSGAVDSGGASSEEEK